VLDIANPGKPQKVSQLSLGADQFTHWLAWDDVGSRIIVNSGGTDSRLFMLRFDRNTGAVTMDSAFRNAGSTTTGFSLSNIEWPHGFHGSGLPHGAVFSR
jgi:hypothetical protein